MMADSELEGIQQIAVEEDFSTLRNNKERRNGIHILVSYVGNLVLAFGSVFVFFLKSHLFPSS